MNFSTIAIIVYNIGVIIVRIYYSTAATDLKVVLGHLVMILIYYTNMTSVFII